MLKKGYGDKSVSANIKTEQKAGISHEQAVAIALRTADEARKKAHKR